jgi:tetratricopeptide (TPR) repeat protein
MSLSVSRVFLIAASLVWLSACESSTKTGLLDRPPGAQDATASASDTTASTAQANASEPAATTPDPSPETPAATASASDVTGAVFAPIPRQAVPEAPPLGPWSATEDPNDELSLGKRQFREGNYGAAEKYFQRVVEHENVPAQRKAEAWIGLAASYDRLKRFDLADRAYRAATAIVGATPEILNNQGYSYFLRGDYSRARAKYSEALEKDPTNPYIQNNIELLERSIRGGGGRKKV